MYGWDLDGLLGRPEGAVIRLPKGWSDVTINWCGNAIDMACVSSNVVRHSGVVGNQQRWQIKADSLRRQARQCLLHRQGSTSCQMKSFFRSSLPFIRHPNPARRHTVVFQHYGASSHTSLPTTAFLRSHHVNVLPSKHLSLSVQIDHLTTNNKCRRGIMF